jgi:hypothetical protein
MDDASTLPVPIGADCPARELGGGVWSAELRPKPFNNLKRQLSASGPLPDLSRNTG